MSGSNESSKPRARSETSSTPNHHQIRPWIYARSHHLAPTACPKSRRICRLSQRSCPIPSETYHHECLASPRGQHDWTYPRISAAVPSQTNRHRGLHRSAQCHPMSHTTDQQHRVPSLLASSCCPRKEDSQRCSPLQANPGYSSRRWKTRPHRDTQCCQDAQVSDRGSRNQFRNVTHSGCDRSRPPRSPAAGHTRLSLSQTAASDAPAHPAGQLQPQSPNATLPIQGHVAGLSTHTGSCQTRRRGQARATRQHDRRMPEVQPPNVNDPHYDDASREWPPIPYATVSSPQAPLSLRFLPAMCSVDRIGHVSQG